MDCDTAKKIVYENRLGDYPLSVQEHLRNCADCDREAMKISKLEQLFKVQALEVKKPYLPMKVGLGLSACIVALFFLWPAPSENLWEPASEETAFSLAAGVSNEVILDEEFSYLEEVSSGQDLVEDSQVLWSTGDEISLWLEETADQAFDLSYRNL